jgi:hypothetical protein
VYLAEVYRRFGSSCCLHHRRPDNGGSKISGTLVKFYQVHNTSTQKTAIFILTAARNLDLFFEVCSEFLNII